MILILTACSKGKDNYENGLDAYHNGDYEVAADEFSEAMNLNPDRGDYFLAYGNTLLILQNYEEAVNVFNQVITNKDSKIVRENNKNAHYGKGIANYNRHEYDKAIEQFDLALSIDELDDMDLDILLYKSDAQIGAKTHEKAIDTLTVAIQQDPSNANIYFKRSNIYKELGDYTRAEADLDEAMLQEEDSYEYHFAKYFLFKDQNKEDEAAMVLDNITGIKVVDAEDIYNNAKANYYLGNLEIASDGLLKAVDGGISEGYYYLGKIKEQANDYEGAIAYYESFLTFPPEEYDIADYYIASGYNQMGYCYLETREFDQALDSFNKGLEFSVPQVHQVLLTNKVVSLERLGDYNQAYKVLQDYVSLYPDDDQVGKELDFAKTRLAEATVIDNEK